MIRMRTMPNGVRVATDAMENVRSCSIGVWLEVGSRHERGGEFGLTHFIEHMLFKGTPRHDALQLADELNRLGGQFNAHTSQEVLCLHARCIDEKAPAVLELFTEMLLDSTFPEEEIGRERNVILEEYKMYEDNPDEQVFDLFFSTLWPDSPLGRPIIGVPETIKGFSRGAIRRYLGREFDPSRILVVMSGNFDSKECTRILNRKLGKLPPATKRAKRRETPPKVSTRRSFTPRPIEQVHFCFGLGGPERGSADRYDFGLLNMILGGGMSSRLFKEVREKRGLVYSIQSFAQPFAGTGSFAIVGSTSLKTLDEVIDISMEQMRDVTERKVDEQELDLAREQIVDTILLAVESTSSRMMHLAESIMTHERNVSADEIINEVKKVTAEGIQRVARKYLKEKPLAGAFIGPKGTTKLKSLRTGSLALN